MPARKTPFYPNSYYHLYNRGIDGRQIFTDQDDLQTFTDAITYYLAKLDQIPPNAFNRTGLKFTGLFEGKIKLTAFHLTQTDFHLVFFQTDPDAIKTLMQRIGTSYSMYYNLKHKRSGTLFEGRYKAKHIDTLDYLLETTKYLHKKSINSSLGQLEQLGQFSDSSQPANLSTSNNSISSSSTTPHSSYPQYLNSQNPLYNKSKFESLIDPKPVLDHFNSTHPGQTYQDYIENSDNVDWFKGLLSWLD